MSLKKAARNLDRWCLALERGDRRLLCHRVASLVIEVVRERKSNEEALSDASVYCSLVGKKGGLGSFCNYLVDRMAAEVGLEARALDGRRKRARRS